MMIIEFALEILAIAYFVWCVTIGSTCEVYPVEIFIDDRPYATDPAKEGQQLWITAEKIGKNGNVKKRVMWETTGGELTAGLIEGLKQSTAYSRYSSDQLRDMVRNKKVTDTFDLAMIRKVLDSRGDRL